MFGSKKVWNKWAGYDIKPTQRRNLLLEYCKSPSEIIAKLEEATMS
jgi:hypothetical protein